jgi:hypothetical protein
VADVFRYPGFHGDVASDVKAVSVEACLSKPAWGGDFYSLGEDFAGFGLHTEIKPDMRVSIKGLNDFAPDG